MGAGSGESGGTRQSRGTRAVGRNPAVFHPANRQFGLRLGGAACPQAAQAHARDQGALGKMHPTTVTDRTRYQRTEIDTRSHPRLTTCIVADAVASLPARSLTGAPRNWSLFPFTFTRHFYGGVPDSTFGWSAPLHVEDGGWPRESPTKKITGNYEEMPLAA